MQQEPLFKEYVESWPYDRKEARKSLFLPSTTLSYNGRTGGQFKITTNTTQKYPDPFVLCIFALLRVVFLKNSAFFLSAHLDILSPSRNEGDIEIGAIA